MFIRFHGQGVQGDPGTSYAYVYSLIKHGVPQGSILGPLLFLIYINDLCNISVSLKSILFADDTNYLLSHKNVKELVHLLNKELKQLSLWFKVNKLSLNIGKTNYIVFGNKNSTINAQVYIENNAITEVKHTKFLGVLLDNDLSWNKQILTVENKVSKGIGLLYIMKNKLDNIPLKMLYSTLILPYLDYCSEIWANTYKSRLDKLVTLQKKAIRIIDGLNYRDHTGHAFQKWKVLKLRSNRFKN